MNEWLNVLRGQKTPLPIEYLSASKLSIRSVGHLPTRVYILCNPIDG